MWVAASPAPVTDVSVFTDRARVTRTAQVSGGGAVEFPALPDTVDPQSIRVEAKGAEVKRVQVERLTPETFRTAEATQLLAELDGVDADLSRLAAESQAVVAHREALSRLTPSLPEGDHVKPKPKLSPREWVTATRFQEMQFESSQKRLRELEASARVLTKKREVLAERARKLGQPESRSGFRVVAFLNGTGGATVSLTYVVRRARWTPSWDVQLDPEKNVVTVSLAGLVTQQSGEDWENAALTLSTAVPLAAVKAPKLLTWKIGTTERFIPTPSPVREFVKPVPIPAFVQARLDDELVRGWLLNVVGQRGAEASSGEPAPDEFDQRFKREEGRPTRRAKDLGSKAEKKLAAPPPSAPSPAPANEPKAYEFEGDDAFAAPVQVTGRSQGVVLTEESPQSMTSASRVAAPVSSFSLQPPPSYRLPVFASDSPVTLSEGYDLVFPSRQRETIPSADGVRRVALLSQQWPVSVERRIYPALAKEAYLSAELKNTSNQVLPGGSASLSVGADPSGTAQLKLMSPGETVTLPLGLDRAIRTVRNVQVVDSTQGFVAQDDVSTYVVTIELVNPYRAPVALRVFDQWPLPLPNQKDVETKLLESKPLAILEALTGKLEWRIGLAPNEKKVLSFSYQVKRPRSWRLYQHEVKP
jgi:hypothetical protein